MQTPPISLNITHIHPYLPHRPPRHYKDISRRQKKPTHTNRHQLTSTDTFSHLQTTPGRVWGCRGILLVSICFCWRQFVHGWCLEDVLGVFGWCLCMFVVFGCVWVLISCRVENLYCFGTAQLKVIFFSPGYTEISKYQNVHIYPEQKWLGFIIF